MGSAQRDGTHASVDPGTAGDCEIYHQGVSTLARPTEAELVAWRSFLRSHALILRRLESDLLARHELPLSWYDVLLQLAESPERRLRMTELASRVLLSRSGVTRLVDRLERVGLVARAACPGDARVTHAVLTKAGLQRLREAAPTHLGSITEHFTQRLTPAELAQLASLTAKLTPAATATDPSFEGGCAPT